ncbi:MAG: EAL domain-containing protein [Desulfonatronovibrio sp.]
MNNLLSSDLDNIIAENGIVTHFQPIISVKRKSIVGFEALSRGVHPENNSLIPPLALFQAAEKFNKTVEIDRLCREMALHRFSLLRKTDSDLLLFINFDTSMVDKGIVGSGNFMQSAQRHGLPPANIVIELVESRVTDLSELIRFVDMYRRQGFLIALDDFGAGHSNLERISSIKPDIIKIDRSLVSNVQNEFYKQEILKSIIKLTGQLGTMVLSEGVERHQEVVKTMDLGTDLLQGYFFSRPCEIKDLCFNAVEQKIKSTASHYFQSKLLKIRTENRLISSYQNLSAAIMNELEKDRGRIQEQGVRDMIAGYSLVECAYMLDPSGRQITSTIMNNGYLSGLKSSFLFKPAEKGDDHSLKDYFVYIQAGLDRFITEPYISLATGNLCRTISMTCPDHQGQKCIFCLDLKEDGLRNSLDLNRSLVLN